MVKPYTCPTCGNDSAVWHLRISTSSLTLCEKCYGDFCNRYSRINSFSLNEERTPGRWRYSRR